MKLVDFPEYARVAQLMWDRGLLPMSGKYLAHRAAAAAGQDDTARKRRRLQKGHHEHRRSLTGRSAGHVTRRMADPAPTDGTGRDASGIDDRHNSQFFERRNVSDWANRGLDPGSDNIYNAPVPRAAKSTSALPSIPYNGTLFLTTEDPQVIAEANDWGAANHWTVVYTNLFDRYFLAQYTLSDSFNRYSLLLFSRFPSQSHCNSNEDLGRADQKRYI